MKKFHLVAVLLSSFLFAGVTIALEPMDYQNAAEEQRFKELAAELRCVMCQNQSIADSSAPIAHDLRLEVLRLMREGKTDAQIKDYLVARYTEFVLYEPAINKRHWLLWLGPFILLLSGIFIVARAIRKKKPVAASDASHNEEW